MTQTNDPLDAWRPRCVGCGEELTDYDLMLVTGDRCGRCARRDRELEAEGQSTFFGGEAA